MPRPDRLWLVLLAGVLAVAVGGCKSQPKARLGPSEAPVYSVRDPDNVRRQVRLQDLLALAARDMQVGNLDAAERKAREALKLAPESPDALVLMAGIDERRGRTQQAGESFRRAAEQAPQRGDVLNNYGAWLCQQGRPAESLAWFDRALQAPGYATPAEAQANAPRQPVRRVHIDHTARSGPQRVRDLLPVFALRRERLRALIADRDIAAGAAGAPIAWGDERGDLRPRLRGGISRGTAGDLRDAGAGILVDRSPGRL